MSYWDLLDRATIRLEAGEFAPAERLREEAVRLRGRSGLRVLWSERLPTAWRRLRAGRGADGEPAEGPWPVALSEFRSRFLDLAAAALRGARTAAERPESLPPAAALPVLAAGLHLAAHSRLHPRRPELAGPLLAALLKAAAACGRLPAAGLLPRDLDLGAGERLDVAVLGLQMLEAVGETADEAGGAGAGREGWAGGLVELLGGGPAPVGALGRCRRDLLRGRLADRHLGDPGTAVRFYEESRRHGAEAGAEEGIEAAARLIELLGNLDAQHFPVPRHAEAAAVVDGLAGDEAALAAAPAEVAGRARAVVAAWERRRPRRPAAPLWASLAEADGRLAAVVWEGGRPADLALAPEAMPGEGDEEAWRRFLAACGGRIVGEGGRVGAAGSAGGPQVSALAEVLLEPWLPAAGLTAEAVAGLTAEAAAAWRAGWRRGSDHPLLEPARAGGGPAREALRAGLLWLACLDRVRAADPHLSTGVGRLAAAGDRAGALLVAFGAAPQAGRSLAGAGDEAARRQRWLLTPLTARPAPPPPREAPGGPGREEAVAAAAEAGAGPGATILGDDEPGRAVAAWAAATADGGAAGAPPLRVVLDGDGRLPDLAGVVKDRAGWTLLPPGGRPHRLDAAVELLERLLAGASGPEPGAGLLPLLHWCRMAETHDGDLLDHRRLRPRPDGVLPWHDRYAALVEPLERGHLAEAAAADPWVVQCRDRLRDSALVAGTVAEVPEEPGSLGRVWGLDGAGTVDWVFLDTAAVHWQLRRRGMAAERLHGELARAGGRHLSVLTRSTLLPDALAALLARALAPYGDVRRLGAAGLVGSLRLALLGPPPDAAVLVLQAAAAPLLVGRRLAGRGRRPRLALPGGGRLAPVWEALVGAAAADGAADAPLRGLPAGDLWRRQDPDPVIVPLLESLEAPAPPLPERADLASWRAADRTRRRLLAEQREGLALELAALAACPASTVHVTDTRWWRRFGLATAVAAGPAAPPPVTPPSDAAAATAAAESAGGHCFDLPLAVAEAESVAGEGAAALVARVRAELARRDRLDPAGRGEPPGAPAPPVDGPAPPAAGEARLLVGPAALAAAWSPLLALLAETWEGGRSRPRALLVATAPPPGAAELVSLHPTAAASVPPGPLGPDDPVGWATEPPADGHPAAGPLLWVAPTDADLEATVRGRDAAVAVAGDVGCWVPAPEWPPRGSWRRGGAGDRREAAALRALLAGGPGRLLLHAGSLPPPWRTFLVDGPAGWAGRELEARQVGAPATGGVELPAVRPEPPRTPCPACGRELAWRGEFPACEACGAEARWWLDAEGRRVLGAALVAGREEALAQRRRRLGAPAEAVPLPAPGDLSRAAWPEGAVLVCHPIEIGSAGDLEPAGAAARLGRTLGQLPRLLAPGGLVELEPEGGEPAAEAGPAAPPAPEAAVPGALLEAATGLPGPLLRDLLAALLWAGACRGPADGGAGASPEPLTVGTEEASPGREDATAEGAGGGAERWLLPAAAVESRLRGAVAVAERLLPPLLADLPPGQPTQVDLGDLPLPVDAEDLAWLDRLLLAAGREGDLLYRAPAGFLFSRRRLLGVLGGAPAALERLHRTVDLWLAAAGLGEPEGPAARLGDLIGARLRPPEGTEARRGELAAAAAAGLAADPAVGALLAGLAAERGDWERRLRAALRAGLLGGEPLAPSPAPAAPVPGRGRLPLPRGWRRAGGGGQAAAAAAGEEVARAAEAVAGAASAGAPALLVLRGLAGSGRGDALLAGLERALAAGLPPEAVVWHCPDPGSAAELHLRLRRRHPEVQPDLRLGSEDAGPDPEGRRRAPGRPRELAFLLEAQRWPRRARYRLARHWGEAALVVTLDPAEAEEAWEHLLPTTPASDAVHDLTDQLRLSRRLWDEVASLAGEAARRPGRALRRERGECRAEPAENLDEAVAQLLRWQERASGPREVAVVAPRPEDLEHLAAALAAAGWLPVWRTELEFLLLPGPFELMALLWDEAAAAGEEAGAEDPGAGAEGASAGADRDGEGGAEDSGVAAEGLLSHLLPPAARRAYREWRQGRAAPAGTVAELLAVCRGSRWAAAFLACPRARARVDGLAAELAGRSPASVAASPLGQAWRRAAGAVCGAEAPAAGPLLALLSTPADPPGAVCGDGAYLCQGPEPARQHYRILSRFADRCLALYQERSPVGPGGREDD